MTEKEHDCALHLQSSPNDTVVSGGEVFVYRTCSRCGKEFETTYEYVETHPV